jgi:hypothetical protein
MDARAINDIIEAPAGLPQVWDEIEQLKAIIQEQSEELKILRETRSTKSDNALETIEQLKEQIAVIQSDVTTDRKRITKLEKARIQGLASTDINRDRIKKLEMFLRGKPGKRASYTEIKGCLDIKSNQLTALIKTLESNYPDAFAVSRSLDHKKKILTLKQSLQFEVK